MNQPAPQPSGATYADLQALPDHVVGEILHGSLEVSPRPAPKHSRASGAVNHRLFGAYDDPTGAGPGGWWILMEPELHIEPHVLVPDLAGWRRERMPELPDAPYFDLAPDWVCEVLSPSTRRIDRMLKLPIYGERGVQHVWLIDPLAELVEVYERRGDAWALVGSHGVDETVRLQPFPAAEIPLPILWGRDPNPG
jgi:Uma2 family endonuclease